MRSDAVFVTISSLSGLLPTDMFVEPIVQVSDSIVSMTRSVAYKDFSPNTGSGPMQKVLFRAIDTPGLMVRDSGQFG